MKASKFSESQIAFVLRQGEEGTSVEEICRKTGISQATYYNWKKKYGGLLPSEMKRLRQLEEENSRLKRIVADRSTRRCCRTSSSESSKACPPAAARRSASEHVEGQHQAGLQRHTSGAIELPLQKPPPRTGRPQSPHQGNSRDAGTLRLSAYSCPALAGRLAREREVRLPSLPRVRPAIAQQNAQAKGEGEAAR